MKNFIQPGDAIDFTAGADYLSGDLVLMGDTGGVCATDIANTKTGEVVTRGVFLLPKSAGDGGAAQGAPAYFDGTTTKHVTAAATHGSPAVANKKIGYFVKACLTNDATAYVKLTG